MRTIHASINLIILLTLVLTTSAQAQFRGWSPQARGTAIGAGVGGAAGAIINKRNRVVGGLIGAAAGSAAGYGIGKGIDNRRKTNARVAAAERAAADARQEAQLARHEAQLARQEAAVAAHRPAKVVERTTVASRHSKASPAATGAVAGAGFGAALAASAFTAQNVSNSYTSNALFLPNASYGDQSSAYPTSEVRRKSW